MSASIGDMRKVKDCFREGMNAAGGNDVAGKHSCLRPESQECVSFFLFFFDCMLTYAECSSSTTSMLITI